MTVNECVFWLLAHDNFLILSHTRPDGDTLCSGAALCSALRRSGKTAYCYENPETTKTYTEFVAGFNAPKGFEPAVVVTVDVADTDLFPIGIDVPIDLAIDHHASNGNFAPNTCLDADKSSCGELVLELVKALCGDVTAEEANLLYIAVSTDTGCFSYLNTNASTFRAGAELLDLGADNRKLNILLFRNVSRARLALEGMIITGLRYFKDGRIVVSMITLDMMKKAGATENDCEDIAGIPGKVEGSYLSITIRQIEPEKCKISLRSKPHINSSDICAVFGGGGHAMAAGCTIYSEPEEALRRILGTIYEKWPKDA